MDYNLIRQVFQQYQSDPVALRGLMTQYGVGVTDLQSAGFDLNTIAAAINPLGRYGDFGGLHYDATGNLTGTDWGGPISSGMMTPTATAPAPTTPAKFDPTGMTPVMGVTSQEEGGSSTTPQEGYLQTVGDKNYYYDMQGNFLRGYRDAGNGWTAPINATGVDIGAPSNTSRDNSFGALVNDVISDPTFLTGAALLGGAAYLGAGSGGLLSAGEAAAGTAAGTAAATDAGIYGLSGGTATLGAGSVASTGTAAATGGLGLTVPSAAAGATLGGASAAGTAAALGGTTLASGLGGTTLGPSLTTVGGGLVTPSLTNPSSLVPGLLNTAGGIVAGNSAVDAAKTQADAQIRAAQIAADAAKFRPVGVTTGFGSSNFGYDDKGNLTSAGYTLTPQMQALRDQALGASGGLMTQATGAQAATAPMGAAAQTAMQLGQGYLSTDPMVQAQKYYADQMGLLAPTRAADMAALQAQMQAQGRGGFAIGGGVGGQGAANPQLQAFLNAQMQQNNQIAADSTRGGMDYAKFGAGMVGTGGDLLTGMYNTQTAAYNPFKTNLGTAQTIEGLGQNALEMGMDMGSATTAANRTAGGLLASGMTNAANTMAPANAYSPWGALLTGAGNTLSSYKFDPMTGKAL